MGFTWSQLGGPQKGESPYAVCPALQKIVLEEEWETLLVQEHSPYFELIDVDLSVGTYSNPFRHEYRVATDCNIHTDCPMIILFPHHPVQKKQVLWTCEFGSMAALGGEINDRLPSFKAGTGSVALRGIQMAVLLDTRVIRVRGTIGTCYVVWLSRYNEISVNDQSSNILRNVPCIVEKNGQMSYRNMVVLTPDAGRHGKRLQSIDMSTLILEDDTDLPLYTREDDPRKELLKNCDPIIMRTTAQAMDIVTQSGVAEELVQDRGHVPEFENDGDSDEDILVLAEGMDHQMEVSMEQETPRHIQPGMKFTKSDDETI